MDVLGKKVVKISGKPFKSKLKENTVKGIIDHPVLEGKQAYTFYEDDSYVRVEQCRLVLDTGMPKMIQFVNSGGSVLFSIPDGGKVIINHPDGEKFVCECNYIDEFHAKIGNNVYHIREFAERMEPQGVIYTPESESFISEN